jgi:hypothetical protein
MRFWRFDLAFALQSCTWKVQTFSADYRTVRRVNLQSLSKLSVNPLRRLSELASESLTIDGPQDLPVFPPSQFFRQL